MSGAWMELTWIQYLSSRYMGVLWTRELHIMIQAIILIVLAIVIAPVLLPVLTGATGILFTIYKEGFSNPDILIVIFATIVAIWFLGAWGKAGKGRKK